MRVETSLCKSRGGHTCLNGPQCSGLQTCGYANGLHAANYTVPAIQYDAMINPLGVEIALVKGDWNDKDQVCETVYLCFYQ